MDTQVLEKTTVSFQPIIVSALDTDLYKLTMLQFIWKYFRKVQVTWAVTNRSKTIHLADEIDCDALRAQLKALYDLRFTDEDISYLKGLKIFSTAFLKFLKSFDFSDVTLSVDTTAEGQYDLNISGSWMTTTLWEIYVLAIINEMASKDSDPIKEADDQEAALFIVHQKFERLIEEGIKVTDFGTRRRHSFAWQEKVLKLGIDLGVIVGTSNVYFARKFGVVPIGTNAHELPMTLAALAENDNELKLSQYKVTELWQEMYPDRRTILPDTFGTTQFFGHAPEYLLDWPAVRPDSKEPIEAGEEIIYWWVAKGRNLSEKTITFADGLDVDISLNNDTYTLNGSDIVEIRDHFAGRGVKVNFGWGTNLTNDFRVVGKKAMSIVCKLKTVNGKSAVKLSDNYSKAIGTPEEIARYRRVFGTAGQTNAPVNV